MKPPIKVFLTAKDWLASSGLNLEDYYKELKTEVNRIKSEPKGVEQNIHWKFKEGYEGQPPPSFVAAVPEGRVIGKNGAVMTADHQLLWDLSMEYGITPEQHPLLSRKRLPPVTYTEETIAVLTFCKSEYYYHWMFDVLPRLGLLEESKIPISRTVFNRKKFLPFQEETLAALGYTDDRIIECGKDFHLQGKKLIVPSSTGYTGYMPKSSCDFLRKKFARKKSGKYAGIDRIYVSRENAQCRKVLNEHDVFRVLDRYGFQKVILETMSVADQADLFSSANIIVAPHGGGLTNLVFCEPGTKVIEIFSPKYVNVLYWVLSTHMDLDYYYCIGDGERPPSYEDPHIVWDNIVVNMDHLSLILQEAQIRA